MSNGLDVTARLIADTADYDAKMKRSGSVTEATAAQAERAAARMRAAWERELQAQDRASQKAAEVARAKELAALKADILARSVNAEADATDRATAAAERYGHASISQMQATSAAVRAFEGNPGIRAVERFLTTIPGVGKALQMVFPIVGALAFAGIMGEVIGKVKELYDNFLTLKTLAADVMKGMATAADAMATSWGAALGSMHSAGMRDNPVGTLRNDLNEAQETLRALEARREALHRDMAPLYRAQVTGNYLGYGTTEEENDLDIQGNESRLKQMDGQIAEYKAKIVDLQSQVAQASKKQEKKNDADDGRVARERLHQMELQLSQWKQVANVTLKAEYDFWQRRIGQLNARSSEYKQVSDKMAEIAQEGARKASEAFTRYREGQRPESRLSSDEADKGIAEFTQRLVEQGQDVSRTGTRWEAYNSEVLKGDEAMQRASQAALATALAHQVATGQVSRYDAAVTLAAAHQQDYAERAALLQRQLAQLQADRAGLNPGDHDYETKMPELVARQQAILNQIAQTHAEASAAGVSDQWQEFSQTALGGAVTALQQFVAATTNAAEATRKLTDGVLENVNGAIMRDLTSRNSSQRRNVWADAGRGIFSDVAGAGLKTAEGSLLGSLFGGSMAKLGTRSNPMWVQSAGLGTAADKGVMDLGNSLFSSGAPSMPAAKPVMSGLMQALTSVIPGFASGVDDFGGGAAVVGENGPELVNLPRGSSVIPNHKAVGMGGVNHNWDIDIDARGATDPAQVRAQAQQAVVDMIPHIISATSASQQSSRDRRPPSLRG